MWRYLSLVLSFAAVLVTGAIFGASPALATKTRAPVQVRFEASSGKVVAHVRFEAAATQVRIKLYGTRGVSIEGRTAWRGEAVRGQTVVLPVEYGPTAPAAGLTVQVEGIFGGQRAGSVQSVRLDPRPPPVVKGRRGTLRGHPTRVRPLR